MFATETHCARCGEWVDKSLPYRDPDTGLINTMSKSFGHVNELDRPGTAPLLGHLEHLACNTSAGADYGNAKRGRRAAVVDVKLRASGDLDVDAAPLAPRPRP